jgi:hypothetical protein
LPLLCIPPFDIIALRIYNHLTHQGIVGKARSFSSNKQFYNVQFKFIYLIILGRRQSGGYVAMKERALRIPKQFEKEQAFMAF